MGEEGGGGGIHFLNTKTCELGACFLYFSYVLAQNGGGGAVTSQPLHPPGPASVLRKLNKPDESIIPLLCKNITV